MTTARSRALRRRSTASETALWDALRGGRLRGLKFRRQHPIGAYVVDFACVSARLVVELDGAVHRRLPGVAARDGTRAAAIEERGWLVLRFTDEAVLADRGAVLDRIVEAALTPTAARASPVAQSTNPARILWESRT